MSTITVREVLTLPVLRGTFVVAGHGGLERAVTGVNVMEVPDIESFVKGGELLLTTAYPLREHPEDLGGLVRTLARLGLAGLAVKTGRYLEKLPNEALAIANELDFPVMLVPEHTSFNEVIGAVLAVVLTEYGAEPAGAEAIRERLTGVALAGGGLVEIARTLAGALGRHVGILDPDGELLGAGGDESAEGAEGETWSFPITVGGTERGRIVMRGEHEPTLGQRRLIRQACFAAGMHIAQAVASLELDRQMRVLFLEELLAGKPIDESLVRERSRLFGWDFGSDHVVVLARMSHELPDAAVARAAEIGLECGAVAWARGQEAVAIVSAASIPVGAPWAEAEHWGETLGRLGGGRVSVATGSIAGSVSHLAASHTAARSALAIAQATGRSNVRYDLLALERVILAVPEDLLGELVEQELGPLIAADAATGSELCTTLEMFLGTGNAADAARRLFIHYNTMKHRMARISELIAVDLHDPRARLKLAFALQVRKLVVLSG